MSALLHLHHVSKNKQDKPELRLFEGVTGAVNAGERVALLGASGTGKSTLLRIIALLDGKDGGRLELDGRSSEEWSPQHWRKKVSYVAQTPVMLPGSVEHNLRIVSELHGLPYDESLARRCLSAFGLEHIELAKSAADLSGGEKQRIALVRSLLLRPAMLLLDESTSSLDPGSKHAVEQFMNEWALQEGTALLWITHDLEQARKISSQIWFMAKGQLLERGDSESFFNGPATEEATIFLNSQSAREETVNE